MNAIEFNKRYPVGHLGFLHRDNGEVVPTAVRQEAFETGNGDPVAFFDGVSGYYKIDRFKPME